MGGEKIVYGYINCPHCGYENGMRITADKSGKPFGYCEANCAGQLRVGGNPHREKEFFKAHPGIAAAMKGEPEKPEEKPVTVTEKKTEDSEYY